MRGEGIGQQGLLSVAEELTGMAGELSQLLELRDIEGKQRRQLLLLIREVQSWLGKKRLRLEVRRLGGVLKDVSAAYLGLDGDLVTVDWDGNATSCALERLEPLVFSAVISETTSRLLDSISEKVEETNRWRKPGIRLRVVRDNGGPVGLRRPKYILSLINSGGGARDLRVTIRTKRMAHGYGPLMLGRGRGIALDLRRLQDMESTDTLLVELGCKDTGERRFLGRSQVDAKSPRWQDVPLSMVQPTPGRAVGGRRPKSASGNPWQALQVE